MTSAGSLTELDLCGADEVAPGTALKVEAGGLTLAVFNLDGQFYVTDDACTHGPGSLSEGEIFDDIIECNFHQGQFCIRTGEPVLADGVDERGVVEPRDAGHPRESGIGGDVGIGVDLEEPRLPRVAKQLRDVRVARM